MRNNDINANKERPSEYSDGLLNMFLGPRSARRSFYGVTIRLGLHQTKEAVTFAKGFIIVEYIKKVIRRVGWVVNPIDPQAV